jgi:hypothetical protein
VFGSEHFRAIMVNSYMTVSIKNSITRTIVSGYGLDDWAIEVRSPAEAK